MNYKQTYSFLAGLVFKTLVYLMIFASPAFSQSKKIDSLKNVLVGLKEDTSKVIALNDLSKLLYQSGKQDTSLTCAEKAKKLSEKLSFKTGLGNAYINVGNVFLQKGKQEEAMKEYEEALKLFSSLPKSTEAQKGIANSVSNIGNVKMGQGKFDEALKDYETSLKSRKEIGDRKGIATSYTNIAIVHYNKGNYLQALNNNLTALKIELEDNDKVAIARSYNNIGNVYIQQMEHDQAVKYYEKALQLQKELGDKQGMGRSYNNIGAALFRLKKYDEAMRDFEAGLDLKKEAGDKAGMGKAYINIGNMLYMSSFDKNFNEEQRTEKLKSAVKSLYSALDIMKEIGDNQGAIMCYNNLGSFHVSLQKNKEAIDFLKKGIILAKEMGSRHDIKQGYEALHSADSASGNWKAAYEDHKMFLLYRDSLMNEENTRKTVEAQMNFDFEQKEIKAKAEQEKKDAVYEEQIKAQKIIAWTSGALFILILISIVLLFNRSRLKQKQVYQQQLMEQQKEQAIAVMDTQERERKRIAEDLHDSLGHLLSTVKLNLQTLPDDQRHHYVNALQLINQASTEIRNISFDLMPQTLEEEGLIPALHELADKIRKSSLYDIMLMVHDMENFELDKQTKFNIYRIVQEAVNNIMKHADAKEINIQLIKQDKHLTIMIEDDGKGFDMSQMKRSGRGLQNITARAQWLHGTIGIDSTPGRGTTISIDIPLDQKT